MSIRTLKQGWFPKGIRRSAMSTMNRFLRRVSPGKLVKDFRKLGLEPGDLVCVHSSLSGMGYVLGGSETLIHVLQTIIGPHGTLMMPAFTGGGSTYKYVTSNPPRFDPNKTPVTTGYLCEVFRQQPGTQRSLHPTHSVAAAGPLAKKLIEGHEKSPTPFGEATPYDLLIREKGKVLLLNVNANSLMHRVQEITDWPNHYLDEDFFLDIFDGNENRTVKTAVHSPGPYSHMVFPGRDEKEVCFIHFPSYGLPFLMGEKEAAQYQRLHPDVSKFLGNRYQRLLDQDIVRKGRVGYGQGVLFKAEPFTAIIREDMKAHLSRNPALYDRDRLKRMKVSGQTSGPIPAL